MNAIICKEIFPYLKDNKIWFGYKPLGGEMYFHITDEYKEEIVKTKKEGTGWAEIDGEVMGRVTQACWFTNLTVSRKPLILTKTYSPEKYPKYDNYNAVEVGRVENIPTDYDGVMGVPISFFGKHNPNQFEIVGKAHHPEPEVNGVKKYTRLLIRRKNYD